MLKHFMFCSCRTDAGAAEASHRAAQKKTGASARDSGECFYNNHNNNNKINIMFQHNLLFSFILHLALLCSSSSPLASAQMSKLPKQRSSSAAPALPLQFLLLFLPPGSLWLISVFTILPRSPPICCWSILLSYLFDWF